MKSVALVPRALHALGLAAWVLTAGLASLPPPAMADDTEVFFPEAEITDQGLIRPNILFVLDTSGSMGSTDGQSQTRMQRMQEAFSLVMDDLNQNTNVGLMRLSNNQGGPVLFPVASVDAKVSEVDTAGGEQFAVQGIKDSVSEAEQFTATGAVNFAGETVRIGNDANTRTFTLQSRIDEAEQNLSSNAVDTGDGTSSCGTRDNADIQVGNRRVSSSSNHLTMYGLRFTNIDIPNDAVITSARLEMSIRSTSNNVATTTLRIRGERVANSARFCETSNNVNARTKTSASVNWSVPASAAGTREASADISTIIQEIRNLSGWATGSPMTLLIDSNGTSNRRTFQGLVGAGTNNALKPRLVIQYTSASTPARTTRVGLRFDQVQMPRGVTLSDARLELRAGTPLNNGALTVTLRAENADNAAAYTETANNVSSRSYGSGISWTIPAFNTAGDDVQSPNLASIINPVLARTGWCGGNALALSIEVSSGTGYRHAIASRGDPALAPILNLTFDPTQEAVETGCNRSRFAKQIIAGSDDAEQRLDTNAVSLTDTTLELGVNSSRSQYVGLRFTGLNIPRGATVLDAFVDFTASGNSTATTNLTFRGENVGNAATYTTATNHIGTRRANSTAATVAWNSVPSWTGNTVYSSPDVKTIIQEIINRADWNPNNALALMVEGSGTRVAFSFNGSAAGAPKLRIRIQGPAGQLTVRQYLKDLVNAFTPVGNTPTIGALYEAGSYYRGANAFYGRTRGGGDTIESNDAMSNSATMQINHRAVYDYAAGTPVRNFPAGCSLLNQTSSACINDNWSGTTKYLSPIIDGCQSNNIVILSDGIPNNTTTSSNGTSNRSAKQLAETLLGRTCPTKRDSAGNTQSQWACGDELAAFFNSQDQSAGIGGTQTVRTYTIAFGPDLASGSSDAVGGEFLANMAAAGGGQSFVADSAEELATVFRAIIADILDTNTTFVAPAVTVNTFNRLTNRNELYFAVFRPNNSVKWQGNLKRYQLLQLAGDDTPKIYDASTPPQLAVDPATGFFKDGATSFWTPATDGADGPEVAKGGFVSRLTNTRNAYTYLGTNSDLTHSSNALSTANSGLTNAMFNAASSTEKNNLINWARGIDVLDQDADGSTTDARRALGDPLHSEPTLVTYGGTEANPDIAIYFGTNEGGLHAVNSTDGAELFQFMPRELLGNVKAFYDDSGSYRSRPYGMDGPISTWLNDVNQNGIIIKSDGTRDSGTVDGVTKNDHAYLYSGMRRGGRNYYGLDVTFKTVPKFLFQITGGAGDFKELGQTWSRAIKTRMRIANVNRDVLVFTGGYDPANEENILLAPDTMGRALYVVDAATGARLWWAGFDVAADPNNPNLAMSEMIYSTPASPRVIDLDNDGLADRIYLVDNGGQVFRFVLNPDAAGKPSLDTVSGRRIANLSVGTAQATARRFFNAPSVALVLKGPGAPFISVSLGSGHREKPNSTGVEDRFYVLRDPAITNERALSTAAADAEARNLFINGDGDLYDATANDLGSTNETTRNAALALLAAEKGLYIRMVDSSGALAGQKVLTEAVTFNNVVQFASFQPGVRSSNVCSAAQGLSRFYQVNLSDLTPVQDFNDDGTVGGPGHQDRQRSLPNVGLPPNIAVIFPDKTNFVTENPEVIPGCGVAKGTTVACVGADCFDPGLNICTEKTRWRRLPN